MDLEPGQRRATLRASDADRERIVSALRQHHTEGRLTVEEFTDRMHHAFVAKTFGELDLLTRDLPPIVPPLPEAQRPNPAVVAQRRFYQHLLSYVVTNVFMVAIWAVGSIAAGHLLFFWPLWTLLGWGLAVGSHAIRAFGPQDDDPGGRYGRYDRYGHDDRSARLRRDGHGGSDRWSRRHRSRSHVSW